MQRYANLSGKSGIVAYRLGSGTITVEFAGGMRYIYTADRAGAANIDRMHELAIAGRGLSTFISQHIHDRYTRKLD